MSGMENLFKLAELYHTIICEQTHEEGECEFYHEGEMPDKWSQPEHLTWLVEAQNFQKKSGHSVDELLKRMNQIVNSFSLIYMTIDGNHCLKVFTDRLISLHSED